MNNEEIATQFAKVIKFLRRYHRHQVVGMENIPSSGPAILAFNHSLATYDISLLFAAVQDDLGRMPRALADHLFFRVPLLGDLVQAVGGIEGTPENARSALDEGHIIGVAPGGMQEAIRPSDERYQLRWDKRKGFVRLAIEAQVPIVLCVCPKADDIYDVFPNSLTEWAYQSWRIPLIMARGLGPTPLPRPVKLTHLIDKPIYPPSVAATQRGRAAQVTRLHKKVIVRAQELIGRAVICPDNL